MASLYFLGDEIITLNNGVSTPLAIDLKVLKDEIRRVIRQPQTLKDYRASVIVAKALRNKTGLSICYNRNHYGSSLYNELIAFVNNDEFFLEKSREIIKKSKATERKIEKIQNNKKAYESDLSIERRYRNNWRRGK